MGILVKYRRGRRHWRKSRPCSPIGTGRRDGTANQEHLHPPQAAKGEAWIFPWSPREEYGSAVTLTSAQWSWFLTSGSQNVERIHTSVVWSHKAASRKTEENSFMCTWVSLQLLCWAYQQVWHKASHKLDRKGHFPWNYGNSDAGTRRDKCPSCWLRGSYL